MNEWRKNLIPAAMAGLSFLCGPSQAEEGQRDTPSGFLKNLQFSGELSSVYIHTDPVEDFVNPENDVKKIEVGNWTTILRNKISYRDRSAGISLQLEPWISFERHFQDDVDAVENYNEKNIQIGRYQAKFSGFLPGTTIGAQRGIVAWGPAFLSTPSNPFPDSSSTTNPLSEEFGSDFLWFSHAFDDKWSVSAYNNYSRGAVDSDSGNPFQKAFVTAFHYNAYDYNLSVLAGNQEDFGPIYGSYGQWTVNEASVAYFDAGYRKRGLARYPVADPSNPLGGGYNQGQADRKLEFVLGASYTTADDTSFYAEYLYQGSGYDNGELDLSHSLTRNGVENLTTFPALAQGTLGLAASNELPFLGQHTVSLVATKSIGAYDFTLQNQLNIQDYTGRLYGSVAYSHGRVKLALTLLRSYGRTGGAFQQDVETQATTGLMIRY